MFRSRGQRAGHGGRSPWCGSEDIGLKGSDPLKQELRFEQGKKFQDMLDNIAGFSAKRSNRWSVTMRTISVMHNVNL